MTPSPRILDFPANRMWAARICHKLLRIAPDLFCLLDHAKSRVDGYMDLNLEVLMVTKGYRRIALSHYWKHDSGDMIPDPDMEVAIYREWQIAEALTYKDIYTFDEVYPVGGDKADRRHYLHLNSFLEWWLETLAEQGHRLREL